MAVLHAREVAAQQTGAALDVALRQPTLAAVGFDDFADVHARLFFWHVEDPLYCEGGSLVTNSRTGKGEFPRCDANSSMPLFAAARLPEMRIRPARELNRDIGGRVMDGCERRRVRLHSLTRHTQTTNIDPCRMVRFREWPYGSLPDERSFG